MNSFLSLSQGLDSSSSELMQLPHMTVEKVREFRSSGVTSLDSLLLLRKDTLFSAAKRIMGTDKTQNEFLRAVNDLPVLAISALMTVHERRVKSSSSDVYIGSERGSRTFELVRKGSLFAPLDAVAGSDGVAREDGSSSVNVGQSVSSGKTKDFLTLNPDTQCELKFNISALHGSSIGNVFCPMYHRSKIASYWCVLGTEDGRLLCMKKIMPSGGQISCNLSFTVPSYSSSYSSASLSDVTVNGKISNPNDKLYMSYSADYQQQQQQQQQQQDQSTQPHPRNGHVGKEHTLLIYLVSDSVMGLDDAVTLRYRA